MASHRHSLPPAEASGRSCPVLFSRCLGECNRRAKHLLGVSLPALHSSAGSVPSSSGVTVSRAKTTMKAVMMKKETETWRDESNLDFEGDRSDECIERR